MQKMKLLIVLICLFQGAIVSAQIIHIGTKNNSLIYQVSDSKVYQSYYGSKLLSTEGLEHLQPTFNEIYPSFGNGLADEVALIATHDDGTMATDLYYLSHDSKKEGDAVHTVIKLKDKKKPFYVDIHFNAYEQYDIIEQWVSIHHKEKDKVKLNQFATSIIEFKKEDYYLTQFKGGWGNEMHISEEKLSKGIKSIETKKGVRTTAFENPSFVLALNQEANDICGDVMMGALAWSGNYKLSFQVDNESRCRIISGINSFASAYNINSKETFTTPRMVYTFSSEGKNKGSINLHRWIRKYNLVDGDKERPIVLNSWEGAYFSFDADRLKSMMDGAAEMGVEMFVLDDGWFGNKYPRNHDKAGLGDWQVNKEKLPGGIDDLIDHAESVGMKFGIWIEPEMVNPKSELAEKHPDWIMQRKNGREQMLQRTQLLLDLSNPKVQDFVFGVVDDLLTQHSRIAYIKWDANRYVQNFGSTYLSDEEQSHLWIDYANGLESVFKRIRNKYPNTIIQACSSGGGRVELSSMKYTNEFWASDDTDPYERLFIQWGTNHFYPAIATGAHVTKSPNHQTHRHTSLKFRFDVAMGGRLGLELRPDDLEEKDVLYAKKSIELYKKIRPIVQFGDLYRLQSPYDEDGYMSINYVSEDKNSALLMVYSHEFHYRGEFNVVRMQGLIPDAMYKVQEINKVSNKNVSDANGKVLSGDILMNKGIRTDLIQPCSSAVFMIEKVE